MDKFYTVNNCQRCDAVLKVRIQSWFTDDVICLGCHGDEKEIRKSFEDNGSSLEDCGYLPKKGEKQ